MASLSFVSLLFSILTAQFVVSVLVSLLSWSFGSAYASFFEGVGEVVGVVLFAHYTVDYLSAP